MGLDTTTARRLLHEWDSGLSDNSASLSPGTDSCSRQPHVVQQVSCPFLSSPRLSDKCRYMSALPRQGAQLK